MIKKIQRVKKTTKLLSNYYRVGKFRKEFLELQDKPQIEINVLGLKIYPKNNKKFILAVEQIVPRNKENWRRRAK